MTMIVDGLYIGGVADAFNNQFVTAHPTAILNCTKDVPMSPYGVDYLQLGLDDSPLERISNTFPTTNKFIDKHLSRGNRVLVHCYAGISRSAAIVIAYLMYKYNMPFMEMYNYAKSKRGIINPNFGFITQLHSYQQS